MSIIKLKKVYHTSKSDIHITPLGIYTRLNMQYRFKLDPATTEDNVLGTKYYYTENNDGLTKSSPSVNTFINPPFSTVGLWVKKANDQFLINVKSNPNLVIVMLFAARTDTKWFHEIVLPAETRGYCRKEFIKGRLKFRGQENSAPFPMILTFEQRKEPRT